MSEMTKQEYMLEFIKAFNEIEDAMEPLKEHKRDLRKNYRQNQWLSVDDMRQAVRAYRMFKKGDNIEDFKSFFDHLSTNMSGA